MKTINWRWNSLVRTQSLVILTHLVSAHHPKCAENLPSLSLLLSSYSKRAPVVFSFWFMSRYLSKLPFQSSSRPFLHSFWARQIHLHPHFSFPCTTFSPRSFPPPFPRKLAVQPSVSSLVSLQWFCSFRHAQFPWIRSLSPCFRCAILRE